jgi:hypothetical protein
MGTETIDSLEEHLMDVESELEEVRNQLAETEAYGWDLAEAVGQAIHDLELIGEVPLSDVESSVLVIVESLRAAR